MVLEGKTTSEFLPTSFYFALIRSVRVFLMYDITMQQVSAMSISKESTASSFTTNFRSSCNNRVIQDSLPASQALPERRGRTRAVLSLVQLKIISTCEALFTGTMVRCRVMFVFNSCVNEQILVRSRVVLASFQVAFNASVDYYLNLT